MAADEIKNVFAGLAARDWTRGADLLKGLSLGLNYAEVMCRGLDGGRAAWV